MEDLDLKIFNAIKSKPGLKARDIASQLGIDRKIVNSKLYGPLKIKRRCFIASHLNLGLFANGSYKVPETLM